MDRVSARTDSAITDLRWVFHNAADFGNFADEWDGINQAASGLPVLSAAFIALLIKKFATGRELLAIGYLGSTATAMAVLKHNHSGFYATFQPAQAPLGAWIHRPPDTLESLVPNLLRNLPGYALAVGITQQDPELARRPADNEIVQTLDYIQTARVTISAPFDEYWAARGKNLRNNTKRQHSRLQKDGMTLRLETIVNPADVAQAIVDYGHLESAGWKGAEGTAIHSDNAQGRFYQALLEDFCRRGFGKIFRYWYGNSVAAVDLCIESNDTLIVLKTTYDETIQNSSPASLMRHEYFQNLFDEGRIKRIEFYGRVMDWHTKWTDEARTMYHVNFYRWPLLPQLLRLRRGQIAGSPVASASTPSNTSTASTRPAWLFVPVSEFDKHARAWDAIANTLHDSSTLSSAFVATLLSVFGKGNEQLAIYRAGSESLAFGIVHKITPWIWQTFQPSQAPLGLWVQRPDISVDDLLPGLIAALPGNPLLVGITQISERNYPKPINRRHVRILEFAETASILVSRSFGEYWHARDGSVRRQVERRLRRLRDSGIETHLDIINNSASMHDAVAEFGNIESMGWKGAEGTAIHRDNIQGTFYSKLLTDLARRGSATVYRYRFNADTVAMELCIEGADTLVMLKTTYDEKYATHAPGILMRRAIFEHAFTSGRIRQIEFLGKLQPWQEKWCEGTFSLYHVNFYRWSWLATLHHIVTKFFRAMDLTSWHNPRASETSTARAPVGNYVTCTYNDLRVFGEHYRDLFSSNKHASFFFTLPWYQTYVQTALARQAHLRIYAVQTATTPPSPRGALLMCYQAPPKHSITPKTLSGLANYYSSLFGPLIDSGESNTQLIFDPLAASIAADENRWDVIDLHPLEKDNVVFPALISAFEKTGLLVYTYFCFGNWYLKVLGRSYAEYFRSLSSRMQNTITRKERQFAKIPGARIVIYRDLTSLDEGLRSYEQVYAASWKSPEPSQEFIPALCITCARLDWLRLGIAYVGEVPVAAQIWIVRAGVAAIFKLAYDERYANLSAGSLLTARLMQEVIDVDKVNEVDYLTGDDAYKKDWMSDRRERWGIAAFNPRTPRGLLAASGHVAANAAKQAVNLICKFSRIGS